MRYLGLQKFPIGSHENQSLQDQAIKGIEPRPLYSSTSDKPPANILNSPRNQHNKNQHLHQKRVEPRKNPDSEANEVEQPPNKRRRSPPPPTSCQQPTGHQHGTCKRIPGRHGRRRGPAKEPVATLTFSKPSFARRSRPGTKGWHERKSISRPASRLRVFEARVPKPALMQKNAAVYK
ncbi:hypothetical protein EKO04_002138 [Ascochyta lentis]|uniref:Uncharacterized protein n=1 Tax=Ascochyta lentis TaxID=205686 RepID=A0A8H7JC58_9PLEO|nr:hypothetical protein EKO04_002138 [Ascochyta lentis]